MTIEELKVKISVDTSGLKQDINQAKKTISTLGNENGSKKMGSNLGTAAAAAEKLRGL